MLTLAKICRLRTEKHVKELKLFRTQVLLSHISIIFALLHIKLLRFLPTVAVGFWVSLQFLVYHCTYRSSLHASQALLNLRNSGAIIFHFIVLQMPIKKTAKSLCILGGK